MWSATLREYLVNTRLNGELSNGASYNKVAMQYQNHLDTYVMTEEVPNNISFLSSGSESFTSMTTRNLSPAWKRSLWILMHRLLRRANTCATEG
mmetsp:Transcript_25515/g.39530  ORF Transcript_25515/g.39530 Transcript_25515/m.39530 type:complete len:94 (+) Transcript_25515:1449-1730(+)